MPYLGSTIFVGALVSALLVGLVALSLLVRAVLGELVGRADQAAHDRPFLSAVLGAPLSLVILLVGGGLSGAGPGPVKALGLLVLAMGLAFFAVGFAGVATAVGRALPSRADESRPWAPTLRGAIVLELAMLVPLVGWLVVLPLATMISVGAAAIAVVRRLVLPRPVAVPTMQSHGGPVSWEQR
jgi:hypothetical protein